MRLYLQMSEYYTFHFFYSALVELGGSLGMEAGEVEELWSEVMGRYERGVEKLVVDTLRESQYPLEKLACAVSQMSCGYVRETVDAIVRGE